MVVFWERNFSTAEDFQQPRGEIRVGQDGPSRGRMLPAR